MGHHAITGIPMRFPLDFECSLMAHPRYFRGASMVLPWDSTHVQRSWVCNVPIVSPCDLIFFRETSMLLPWNSHVTSMGLVLGLLQGFPWTSKGLPRGFHGISGELLRDSNGNSTVALNVISMRLPWVSHRISTRAPETYRWNN